LSSLEPGDLTEDLLAVLRASPQVVPHFHLPLQSGSDRLLRRMNRQYGREDFLEMAGRVKGAFDRPAITTDIIVGFPGEDDEEFERTVEVVGEVGFLHIHAFSYSPRPKTAAARWTKEHVRGPVVNERINRLSALATEYSLEFRQAFVGQTVEVLVERTSGEEREMEALAGYQHGRCERYFAVHFQSDGLPAGTLARVRVDRVTPTRTFGTLVEGGR
jgi:threonylcarbamoyladenosine tRNA methylthiotransferase MtaB